MFGSKAIAKAYRRACRMSDQSTWKPEWVRLRPQMMRDVQHVLEFIERAKQLEDPQAGDEPRLLHFIFNAGFAAGRLDAQLKEFELAKSRRQLPLQELMARYQHFLEVQNRGEKNARDVAAAELGISPRTLNDNIPKARELADAIGELSKIPNLPELVGRFMAFASAMGAVTETDAAAWTSALSSLRAPTDARKEKSQENSRGAS